MRNIELCRKCNQFLIVPGSSEWSSRGVRSFICSSVDGIQKWCEEKEYQLQEIPEDCKYKLEQTIITQDKKW